MALKGQQQSLIVTSGDGGRAGAAMVAAHSIVDILPELLRRQRVVPAKGLGVRVKDKEIDCKKSRKNW